MELEPPLHAVPVRLDHRDLFGALPTGGYHSFLDIIAVVHHDSTTLKEIKLPGFGGLDGPFSRGHQDCQSVAVAGGSSVQPM